MRRAFTLIELMVVISVVTILSTIVFFGIGNARQDEGLNADYLQFYDDLIATRLRSNLGQLAPTLSPSSTPTTKQTVTINLGTNGYMINDFVRRTFDNGTIITSVTMGIGLPRTSGTLIISFVPEASGINPGPTLMPTPEGGYFAVVTAPDRAVSNPAYIVLTGKSGATKTIEIQGYALNGNTFYISAINKI